MAVISSPCHGVNGTRRRSKSGPSTSYALKKCLQKQTNALVKLLPPEVKQQSLLLQRPTVEVLNRHFSQINSFETANIDGGHWIAFGIGAFPIWVDSTGRAKAVPNHVLVEGVGGNGLFRHEQVKLFARHKP